MNKNKIGVSEIMSYVILVVITLSVSVGVYTWLKYQIPSCGENDTDCFSPIDCPDGTSIMINDYKCDVSGLNMTLENNGRFNITGIILAVTDDPKKIPSDYLTPIGSKTFVPGEFIFQSPLSPNSDIDVKFSKKAKGKTTPLGGIAKIKMQIFVTSSNRRICKNIILSETLKNCIMPAL